MKNYLTRKWLLNNGGEGKVLRRNMIKGGGLFVC
jgi:hypothetical protein